MYTIINQDLDINKPGYYIMLSKDLFTVLCKVHVVVVNSGNYQYDYFYKTFHGIKIIIKESATDRIWYKIEYKDSWVKFGPAHVLTRGH